MRDLVAKGATETEIKLAADEIRGRLNPHPAGQMQLNVPLLDGEVVGGMQHKYQETVLFFPSQGQTCHAYCSYCFRWAQFVGDADLKFASREANQLVNYVRENPQVSSVLITGGDPMVMKTPVLRRYIEPLLRANLPNLHSIRIGTKALAYWPYRFIEGGDADDFLRLIEEVRAAGKHFALMAHSSHSRELEPKVAQHAVERVLNAGAVIPLPGAAHSQGQRQRQCLGATLATAGAAWHGAVLHVCGARHRGQGLLRGAAGPGVQGVHRGV
ncbi:MAG: hypothetical protein CM1200mP29_05730 [Verrucomicrobiota bacterium]|nr:MAG: hypothetical protein CM1200mP29_05730 [Verrucomicrobiota bacterium]